MDSKYSQLRWQTNHSSYKTIQFFRKTIQEFEAKITYERFVHEVQVAMPFLDFFFDGCHVSAGGDC